MVVEKPVVAAAWISINALLWSCQSATRPGAEVVVGVDDAVAVLALERTDDDDGHDDRAAAGRGAFDRARACDVAALRREVIARYDANRDGELGARERAALRREFGGRPERGKERQRARLEHIKLLRWVYDANADRKLDAGEWQTLRGDLDLRCENSRHDTRADAVRRAGGRERFDSNRDGRLDAREQAAAWDARRLGIAVHWRTLIDRFDTDGNGLLNASERAALREYERSTVRGERWIAPAEPYKQADAG
jgi:hypothetical protein